MRHRAAVILAGMLTGSWGAAAMAQPYYAGAVRLEFHSETEVSGTTQSDIEQIPKAAFIHKSRPQNESNAGDRYIEIGRIEFFERSDEPCAVKVFTAVWTTVLTEEHLWDGCNGSRRSRRTVEMVFQTDERGVVPNPDGGADGTNANHFHAYLKAIRVCHANSGKPERSDIVKGVEAEWISHPNRRGNAPDDPESPWFEQRDTDQFSRNNCKGDWQPWARCPNHTVAAALRLHHKSLGGRRALTGISLKCHHTESRLRDPDTFAITQTRRGNPPGGKPDPAYDRVDMPEKPGRKTVKPPP